MKKWQSLTRTWLWLGKLVSSSHQRSEFSNAVLCIFIDEHCLSDEAACTCTFIVISIIKILWFPMDLRPRNWRWYIQKPSKWNFIFMELYNMRPYKLFPQLGHSHWPQVTALAFWVTALSWTAVIVPVSPFHIPNQMLPMTGHQVWRFL